MKVKTVLDKYMDLMHFAIYHAPLLRNHKEFGESMRDVGFEIGSIEESYQRVLSAAKGRGMASEMLNAEEIAVLVCGLHDKILLLEAQLGVHEVPSGACPYCIGKGEERVNGVSVSCRFCGGTGKA